MKKFSATTTIVAFVAQQSAISLPSSYGYVTGGGGDAPDQVAPTLNQYDVCTDFCKGAIDVCEGVVDWVTNTYAVPLSRHVDGAAGTSATGKLGKPSDQFDACHGTCMGWMYYKQDPMIGGTTRYFEGYNIGDSLNCRFNHLQYASQRYGLPASEAESAAEHCSHLTDDGGWVCTDYRNEDGKTPPQIYKESMLKHRMGDCHLAAGDTIADCHRKGLTDDSINQNLLWLPDGIEYIFLQANALTRIPDLSRFTKLKGIYLDNNVIEILETDDFASNTKLEILSINNNFITEIPDDIFTPLTKLKALFFISNYVENLPPTLFSTNIELEMIALVDNKLESFELGTFDGLSALKLLAFGKQGKGPYTGKVFTEAGIPDGLFDDLVSLEYFSTFINGVGVLKSSWFGEWSANVESIAMFQYMRVREDGPLTIEPGVFDKLPSLITISTYTSFNTISPVDVANNSRLQNVEYGDQYDISAPLPFSGRNPKPELIPPSSTPTAAPIAPPVAPSYVPTMIKPCIDSDKKIRFRNEKTGKRISKPCKWVRRAADSRCAYPEAAENCPKSCDTC